MRSDVRKVNAKQAMSSERGQTSTEYMLLVSVVVIAVVAAAYAFVPSFQAGVFDLSNDVSSILVNHGSVKGGWGLAANNASGGGYETSRAQTSPMAQAPSNANTYDPNAGAGE